MNGAELTAAQLRVLTSACRHDDWLVEGDSPAHRDLERLGYIEYRARVGGSRGYELTDEGVEAYGEAIQ